LSSGDTVIQSGTYIDTLLNSTGCDSILYQIVTIQNPSICNPVPSYVPTNGLVGWWGFNGNAQDGSGNGNHGTVNGAILTTDRFGNQNGAYSFDGTSDEISIFNSFINLVSDFTISCWMNSSDITKIQQCIFNSINHTGFGVELNNENLPPNKLTYAVGPANAHWSLLYAQGSYNQFQNNIWYNIVFIKSGTTYTLYQNNQFDGSSIVSASISYNQSVGIRFGSIGGAEFFKGKLDDFGIWNRALTPQEITNLYNSQLPTQISLCLPSITTNTPTSIGIDSVIVGGNITNDGGSSIVLRGVCYSTTPNPNMGNMRTEDGSGVGSFSTILRNLSPSTTYYVRSYAKNSNGVVVYGDEVSFSTSTPVPSFLCGTSTVTDVDGNNYNTVQIGNQCWTQSNLKVSKYRNGDSIPTGLSNSAWRNTTVGAYAIYDNNSVNDGLFGKLYNHYAVMDTRGLCPTGWHVPTDGEWNVMVKFLDPNADTVCNGCLQSGIAGGALKSTAIQPTPGGWYPPNRGATNSSGFTAVPGGLRSYVGPFGVLGYSGYWWSSSSSGSSAWYRILHYNDGDINWYSNNRAYGFSVRCLRD
jgi:uncharacterized protein (TIGR02145 family)